MQIPVLGEPYTAFIMEYLCYFKEFTISDFVVYFLSGKDYWISASVVFIVFNHLTHIVLRSCGCPIPGGIQGQVGWVLDSLIWCVATLPMAGGLELCILWGAIHPKPSMILRSAQKAKHIRGCIKRSEARRGIRKIFFMLRAVRHWHG